MTGLSHAMGFFLRLRMILQADVTEKQDFHISMVMDNSAILTVARLCIDSCQLHRARDPDERAEIRLTKTESSPGIGRPCQACRICRMLDTLPHTCTRQLGTWRECDTAHFHFALPTSLARSSIPWSPHLRSWSTCYRGHSGYEKTRRNRGEEE